MSNIVYIILSSFLIGLIFSEILTIYQALVIYILGYGLDLIIAELRNIKRVLEELNNE